MTKKVPMVMTAHSAEFLAGFCGRHETSADDYGIRIDSATGLAWGSNGSRLAVVNSRDPKIGFNVLEVLDKKAELDQWSRNVLGLIPVDGPEHHIELSVKELKKSIFDCAKHKMFPVMRLSTISRDGDDTPSVTLLDRFWKQPHCIMLECGVFHWVAHVSFHEMKLLCTNWITGEHFNIGPVGDDHVIIYDEAMTVIVLLKTVGKDDVEQPPLEPINKNEVKLEDIPDDEGDLPI